MRLIGIQSFIPKVLIEKIHIGPNLIKCLHFFFVLKGPHICYPDQSSWDYFLGPHVYS
jgi:hypothetical protein